MRTLHLIESAHEGHTTTGLHSFLSVSAHAAMVLAALYATMRPEIERAGVPEARVYFVPEPRRVAAQVAVAATQPAPRRSAPTAQAPAAKAAALATSVPATIPPVDVPLTDPSRAVEAPPAPSGAGVAAAGDAGQPEKSGPYELGEVEVPAAPLSTAGPEYPERAIRDALSGSVTARFIVDANGRVEREVVILDSSSPDFTNAVRSFLLRARYRPARVGGQTVRQLVEQRFVFELRP